MSPLKMNMFYKGRVLLSRKEINLDLTLLGGQSFRWKKSIDSVGATEWRGVAYDAFWILTQTSEAVEYTVYPSVIKLQRYDNNFFQKLIEQYFRIEFDLIAQIKQWQQAHDHFAQMVGNDTKAVRVLKQEPLENILSFICSQNNHIRRISQMINWLCSKYGNEIGIFNGCSEYTFPSLESLFKHQKQLESELRTAKFGYRAKYIANTVSKIMEFGGSDWLYKLRELSYNEARLELVKLPGIGFKVADCICLMSLNHLESVPIDTHIFKVAQKSYMPQLAKVKAVTPKIYEEISTIFRTTFGPYAGWAQAVLFCSELQQFRTEKDAENEPLANSSKKRKR